METNPPIQKKVSRDPARSARCSFGRLQSVTRAQRFRWDNEVDSVQWCLIKAAKFHQQ